jgi:anti-sigma regulatory factor (Ser/Thr protein kinase)
MNFEVSCRFECWDAKLQEVEPISEQILGFLRDQGLSDPDYLSQLELAATEAINNAIEHGCRGIAKKQVSVEVVLSSTGVRLEVADPSVFGGPAHEPSLPSNAMAERGRGLFIISQVSDVVVHETRKGRHVLVIHKSLPVGFSPNEMGNQNGTLSKMTEELGASYEMISALIGLSELLAEAKDKNEFLKMALNRVLELTGADAAYLRTGCPAGLELEGLVGELSGSIPSLLSMESEGIERSVFLTGKEITIQSTFSRTDSSLTNDSRIDCPTGISPAQMDPLSGAAQAVFVTPILYKAERRGILVLAQTKEDQPFFTAVQMQVARVAGEYFGIASSINELQEKSQK